MKSHLSLVAAALLAIASAAPAAEFAFENISTTSLGLWKGGRPVFVYNYGTIRKQGVPADRARGTYIHPLYGRDGEVLTITTIAGCSGRGRT